MSIRIRSTKDLYKEKYAAIDKLSGMEKTASIKEAQFGLGRALGLGRGMGECPHGEKPIGKMVIKKIDEPGVKGVAMQKKIGPIVRVVRNGDVFDNIKGGLEGDDLKDFMDMAKEKMQDVVEGISGKDLNLFGDEDKGSRDIDWGEIDQDGVGGMLDFVEDKADDLREVASDSDEDAKLEALQKLIGEEAEELGEGTFGQNDAKQVELLNDWMDLEKKDKSEEEGVENKSEKNKKKDKKKKKKDKKKKKKAAVIIRQVVKKT